MSNGGDEVLLGYERYHAFHLGVLLRKLKLKKISSIMF